MDRVGGYGAALGSRGPFPVPNTVPPSPPNGRGGGCCMARSASSWSVRRCAGAFQSGCTSGTRWASTNFPRSLPRYLVKSGSLSTTAMTTSAVTGPLVPGVHAPGYPISGNGRGETTWALKRSLLQPRPNGPHDSSFALTRPHSVSFCVVHSAAALMLGELVSRPPYTSV